MNRLSKVLTDMGLGETHTALFDHLYHNGPSTASRLSSHLSINRATTYHGLHELSSLGLISGETINGSKVYKVNNKDALISYFDFKSEKLSRDREEFISYLSKYEPKMKEVADTTEIFTGESGIRIALEKAFKCRSRSWEVIAPKNNYLSQAKEEFGDYYLLKRKKYKIKARTLWELPKGKSLAAPSVQKLIAEERSPRYLPEGNSGFTSMVILFDSSTLFISSFEEQTVILITSQSVHSLLRMQFEELYKIGTTPRIREK